MGSLVTLGKTISIDTAKPLPQYDNGPAKAYAAIDSGRARGKNLIAIVCDPSYVTRRMALMSYKGLMSPAAIFVVAHGVCYWPLTGDQRFIILYEHNFFGPILEAGKTMVATPWRDGEAIELFIKPLIGVLSELGGRDVYHGSIRLSNIYFTVQGKLSPVILGDGLSVPPSSTQDILYEPVERAMAHPLARGEGTTGDDIYSFGVCLAILLRTIDPMAGLRDEEIIDYKLQHGSYAALAGKDRLSGHILEVLRGCLHDNPEQRWKIEDLQSWVDGRRLTPQQSYKKKKAVRPIDFAGKKYHFARDLAYAMSQNTVLAQTLIESGEMLEWLERSVSDGETVETIRNYLGRDMAKSKVKGNTAVMVSAVISALEPSFPIFYKDKIFFPQGVGNYFAHAVKTGEDISDLAEMIHTNMFMTYVFMMPKEKNNAILVKTFESCRLSLNQANIGFGIERCLYILCPDVQCLSAKFERHFASGIEGMMAAFEDLCLKNSLKTPLFLDRHSVAFLSVMESAVIDGRLFDLNSKSKHQNILANLKVLAAMQKRMKSGHFPNIARVLSEHLGELLSRFHDRELRKNVEQDLLQAAKSGNISEVLEVIDNPVTKSRDKDDFRKAMREYAALREEYRLLEAGMRNPAAFGQESGHNIAAVISWILAIVMILLIIVFHFSGLKR